jgi:hypothetical protein
MSKVTLDHLRKGGVARGLPERAYSLCLRRDLLAEVDSVTERLRDVMVADASVDPESLPPPRLGAPGVSEQEQEVRARLAALYDEMDDSTGELRLRAIRDGDWRQWVNAHPPREEDKRDEQVAYGICNADDLANDLGRWVVSWDDETLAADDWSDHLAPLCSGGDLKALVTIVLQMQEAVDDPKLRRLALPVARTSSAAASQPEPSADPSPSTSDESRPSDTSTTTPTAT